jgi:translation initiation factor IF-2
VETPAPVAEAEEVRRVIFTPHPQLVVKEFAAQMGVKPNILIAELMRMNIFATINDKIDLKVARHLAEKRGFTVEIEHKPPEPPKVAPKAKKVEAPDERADELMPRPPVVTFMGHVDHGKTSLLDYIRKTRVAEGEAGGITQHIGAYMVSVNDKEITFIDTPGHAAFTAMRARGANLTDIAVIVVSAEESVKEQTREAIQHARAAGVSIMVAINKIDLPNADMRRVMGDLQKEGLIPEEFGGQTIVCPVSAKTGQGVDRLLEMILLQAEMMELKAAPRRRAEGYVIEAQLEPGRGPVATLLVKSGTLQVGDAMVCGDYWGRVKALVNDRGVKVRTAGPSYAVQCLGLNAVPEAGARFEVVANDREARAISEERLEALRRGQLQQPRRGVTLDDLLNPTESNTPRELRVILKTDVRGTLEAVRQALADIHSEKVALDIALAGVGQITLNDVLLAKASGAVIFGFHVAAEDGVAKEAKREGVEIRFYTVIYELVEDVQRAMAGLLEPIVRETITGQLEVKQVFELSRRGTVAGCLVRSGRVTSRSRVRVRRQGDVLFQGTVASLRRFQNDAAEVREGQECGIRVDGFSAFQVGDLIEAYEVREIAQQL